MCDFTEAEPDGIGVAACVREDEHPGIHIVQRKDGKKYVDGMNMYIIGHAVQPAELKPL